MSSLTKADPGAFINQSARFLVVGLVNTLTGVLCIFIALYFFGLGDIQSNLAGYSAGFLISYFLNRSWTFPGGQAIRKSLPRFLAVSVLAYGANLVVMIFAHRYLGTNVYISQFSGIVFYTAVSFLGSRYFVFAR